MKTRQLLTTSFVLLALVAALPASAATIDSTEKYGWSNVGGWVNFKPTNGGLTITDSAITGYAWAENTGWISFDTAQSGVTNDGSGNLGGFAWSEGEGWLSFTGVSIDGNGYFNGTATGDDSTLTFDCANCSVRTDWRAVSGGGSSGGSSGGGIIQNQPTTTDPTTPSQTPPTMPGTSNTSGESPTSGTGTSSELYPPQYSPQAPSEALEAATGTSPNMGGISPWVIGGGVFLLLLLFLLFRFFFRPRI